MPPISWTSKWRIAEGPLHRLAGHREDLGQDVVEGLLEALVLALAAGLGQLAAALEIGVVELVLGRLAGDGRLADLLADLVELRSRISSSDRACDLGLERVDLVDQRLEASDLAVVRVDEAGKESHGTVSIRSDRAGRPVQRRISCQKVQNRAVARHDEHERGRAEASQNSDASRSRDVGFISGFLSSGRRPPGSPLPQRGERSWSTPVLGRSRGAARGRLRRRVGGAGGSSVSRRCARASVAWIVGCRRIRVAGPGRCHPPVAPTGASPG